jgi:hypothetical protein
MRFEARIRPDPFHPVALKGWQMAIAWLTVLKAVPWVDVISHAPKVADGAKKLWSSVARKAPEAEPAGAADSVSLGPASTAELEARLASTEAKVAGLHEQMLASSTLIKDLAEQNAQLIVRIEALRLRTRWLTLAAVAACGLAAAQWAFMLGR